MLYKLIGYSLNVYFRLFHRCRVRKAEDFPVRGGCVVVANHCNFFDPLILGAVILPQRKVRFMAKAELFKVPLLSQLLRWIYVFPVRRGAVDRKAINSALEVVRQGHVLGMFPEGTRFRDGRLHELRGGSAMIILATGAPVIPVGLAGTDRIKPGRFPRIGVYIGSPLHLPGGDGLSEREAIAAVNEAIRQGLEECWARARELAAPPRRR